EDRVYFFFFSSRRRHTRFSRDWSSDVCSSDLTNERHCLLYRLKFELRYASASRQIFRRTFHPIQKPLSLRTWHVHMKMPALPARSEERRVGTECRSRRFPSRSRQHRSLVHTAQ